MRKSSMIVLARLGLARRDRSTPIARNRIQEAEAEILAQRQIEEHAFGVAVVGNEADAGVAKRARTVAGDL